jgi:hypothetical protein
MKRFENQEEDVALQQFGNLHGAELRLGVQNYFKCEDSVEGPPKKRDSVRINCCIGLNSSRDIVKDRKVLAVGAVISVEKAEFLLDAGFCRWSTDGSG